MPQHLVPPLPPSPPLQLQPKPNAWQTAPGQWPENVPSDENQGKNGRLKLIGLIITIISITAAAVVWAASEHEKIKDWTMDRQYDMKTEIDRASDRDYVLKEDFIEVRTEQKQIKEKVDDIDEKVDEIHKFLMVKPRTSYNFEEDTNVRSERRNQ